MSKIVINHIELTETLSLAEDKDGFWLYDETRGMNLAMREPTERSAFVESLTYYQERLTEIEVKYNALLAKVNAFVDSVENEE